MMGWGNNSTRQVIDGVHQMTNPSEVNSWEAQAGYDFSAPLTEGTTYFLKMKIKGSVAGSIGAVFQKPDGFAGRGDFPSIPITTEWEEVTVFTNCTGDAATRILFNYGKYAGTIYIDDLSIYWQKSGNTIPLTPEEKEEILTNELERWIKGMLESCGGYVKAWDVVNEPISGKDSDGDGYYDLQSASQTDDNGVSGENFYWQDYLGDDYARIPIKFARKYFAESGGNPDELKLFINDYNLESDWDQNKKLKSLIHWIERWESDGETKVDGIGTQMHVSYYMNPATQASKENAIINMFTLLASTGKLIKITELDMGIVDAAGETILTENLTDEMQQNMSDFYQFIIEKYFEIIPVAQQYGITHWSPTDSPSENSFWRKGQPIGLWDLNYNRKPVYVGFLEGLRNGTASK
jgi:endo-1,4-beta-xylanase